MLLNFSFMNNVWKNSPTDLQSWSFGKCGHLGMSNKKVLCFLIQFNQFLYPFYYGSRLKALKRMSRSPTLAAWNSSGWSIIDRAIRSAAQILPDSAGWGTCCWFLLFLCKLRAVRKLLTASLYAPRLMQLIPKLYLDLMKPGCISKARV